MELQLAWQGQLSDFVTGLVYAPDGRGWAASSAAGEIVWVAGHSEPVVLQAADGHSISSIAFSADGRYLAAGGQAGQIWIWDCADPSVPPQAMATMEIDRWIEQLAWHPTQPYLAISYDSQVQIWDVPLSTELVAWTFDKSSVFDLAWQPLGGYLAVAGYKGVQIWSPTDRQAPSYHLPVDTASINIAWSRNGRYLAAGNLDRTLTIMDWEHPDDQWTLQGCPGKIRQLTWLADTNTYYLAVASGVAIVLWSLTSDANTWDGQLLEGHQDIVNVAIAHPQTATLASGGADGYTCWWSSQGEIAQILPPSVSKFTALAWHPQGLYLATGTHTGEISIWSIPA
ncbi:WD40 repeat domain-containing protein [Chamaesiphon sp.]|uniref:WD40 repeat domain-containing protein n=1 Tax=Chamaesiphon sp. TaxID=2814140 RepID=UPI0035948528